MAGAPPGTDAVDQRIARSRCGTSALSKSRGTGHPSAHGRGADRAHALGDVEGVADQDEGAQARTAGRSAREAAWLWTADGGGGSGDGPGGVTMPVPPLPRRSSIR